MKKVIIIGASYAGLYAIKNFAKLNNIEVIIFDKNPYHYIQVESYGFVSNIYDVNKITVDTNKYLKTLGEKIKFYNKEVLSFNSESKEIVTKDGTTYTYDYLIIATGSLTNFPIQVPNIRKYSTGIKTLHAANKVKQTFESIITNTIYSKNTSEQSIYNFVIGGAGLSGVEIAAEMAVFLENKSFLLKEKSLKINIIIVDGMKTVLPNMDKRLVDNCRDRLEALGIELYLGSFIKDVDEHKIYLVDDTVIDYNYFIFTGGIKAVTLKSNKTYEVNKLNQYIVNEHLQLKNENDIFVIGDTAEVISESKYVPPSAQLAIQTGEYVVSFIKNKMTNVKMNKFVAKSNGILISLGGEYAIGLLYNKLFIRGYIAHKIKHFVTYIHKKKFM